MRPIDPYSYHCGVMDSFCEIVAAGIKPMALSHPFASPEERSEYREYVWKLADQYGVLLAEEDSLPSQQRCVRRRMSFSFWAAVRCRSGIWLSGTRQQSCAEAGSMTPRPS